MTRRGFLNRLSGVLAAPLAGSALAAEALLGSLKRPASYWKPYVSGAAWSVLFEEDTERPGSSPLNKEHGKGRYICAACHQPIFGSDMKFDSGTGWPSFYTVLPEAIGTKSDHFLLYERVEYHCARCGGHMGHRFDDGPPPTGLRYCNNGLSLRFVPEGEALPALRG